MILRSGLIKMRAFPQGHQTVLLREKLKEGERKNCRMQNELDRDPVLRVCFSICLYVCLYSTPGHVSVFPCLK